MFNDKILSEFDESHDWDFVDKYHYERLKIAEELLIPKAKDGELWAIQNLLKLIAEAVDDGARLNRELSKFLSSALIKIYQGEKADSAFGISRSKGQKNTRISRQRNFSITMFIEDMQDEVLEVKFQLAADKFHVSFDTARKAWQKNHAEVKRELELKKKLFSM